MYAKFERALTIARSLIAFISTIYWFVSENYCQGELGKHFNNSIILRHALAFKHYSDISKNVASEVSLGLEHQNTSIYFNTDLQMFVHAF
jgi:hypothetical protein